MKKAIPQPLGARSVFAQDGVIAGWFQFGGFGKFGFLRAGYRDFVLMEEVGEFILGGEETIAVEL